jgi:4-hydroxy-2-oxoheptanedioate aldolase
MTAGMRPAPHTTDGPGSPPALGPLIQGLRPLAGTVLSVPDAALAELVSERLDFVWIDLEHGPLGPRDAQVLAIAARAAGCAALVRLPHADTDLLPALLDAGVDGVVAPKVDAAETARRLVTRLRYPPEGTRGSAPRRANAYARESGPARAVEPACVIQIETRAGVENAPEIAEVDGVDALVVGCSDLSLDLGVPGQLDAPALLDAVRAVQAAAAGAGVASGIAAACDAATLADMVDGRSTMVVYASDVRMYARAVDDGVNVLDDVFARAALERTWPGT